MEAKVLRVETSKSERYLFNWIINKDAENPNENYQSIFSYIQHETLILSGGDVVPVQMRILCDICKKQVTVPSYQNHLKKHSLEQLAKKISGDKETELGLC